MQKDCDEQCQLFRWNKCSTKDESGKCDNLDMYDSDELEYKR